MIKPYYDHAGITIYHGDCREILPQFELVDSVVTDPPYGLKFMGKGWDHSVPGVLFWEKIYRVLKPGAHLLAFGGTRTYHRLACAIEDAGFEIRDMVSWIYGSGFPKSLDVGKAIDKHGGQPVAWFGPWFRQWRKENNVTQKQVAALFPSKTGNITGCVANWELGFNMPTPDQFNLIRDTFDLPFEDIQEAEREVVGKNNRPAGWFTSQDGHDVTDPATEAAKQWDGWGTALKPAHEPICLARKPLIGTVAENVLEHSTGALNIDGCRVGKGKGGSRNGEATEHKRYTEKGSTNYAMKPGPRGGAENGRWPANVIHDGSDEVVRLFPSNQPGSHQQKPTYSSNAAFGGGLYDNSSCYSDQGSAARFFYCAKASKKERGEGNTHPTVKPLDLINYLCRLITPNKGMVLDPFMGSGPTLRAAKDLGYRAIGIEIEEKYCEIAANRLAQDVFDFGE